MKPIEESNLNTKSGISMKSGLCTAFPRCLRLWLMIGAIYAMPTSVYSQSLVINEIMSANGDYVSDFEGSFPDWIELHNPSEEPIDLTDYALSDRENEAKWTFPSAQIEAGGFLVIFASGKDLVSNGEMHTNFKLSSLGEQVFLYNKELVLIDRLDFPEMFTNQSFGRSCDPSQPPGFLQAPTFNDSNCNVPISGSSGMVAFSLSGGFYESDTLLALSCDAPNAEVRYTLDNSLPTSNSLFYTEPIELVDRSPEPNQYANIQSTIGNWDTLEYQITKLNVVRAGCFIEDSLLGEIKTRSYLIDPQAKTKYTLPVISLVTEPHQLFSDSTGIYVPGTNDEAPNYDQKGREWERPIHMEYLSSRGEVVLMQNAGARIHGGTTRIFANKSLRLYARSEYGRARFSHDFFEGTDIDSYKRLILRNSGQDIGASFFRDALVHEILKETSLDVQAYSPVILFLNGEYWGLSNLRERQDEHYIASHYGVDPESVSIDDFGGLGLIDFVVNHDMTIPSNYEELSRQMNMPNFIELCIADNFFYRWDYANRATWKTPDDPRQRFFLFDMDVALAGFNTGDSAWTFNYFQYMADPFGLNDNPHMTYVNSFAWVYRELIKNEEFRSLFVETYLTHLRSTFSFSKVIGELSQVSNRLRLEIDDHIRRWGQPRSKAGWEAEIFKIKEFLRQRPCVVYRQLSNLFGLRDEELEALDCDALVVGLEDIPSATQLQIYPNPSKGNVSLLVDELTPGEYFISLYSETGQIVYRENSMFLSPKMEHTMDLSHLQPGLYFVLFRGPSDLWGRIILE